MLLSLTLANYKSFREEQTLSMEAVPKMRELEYSLLRERIGRRSHKAVSVGIVYGPNASGKTNIISAAETLRAIVLRGNIRNPVEQLLSPNRTMSELEMIPNIESDGSVPTKLGVGFVERGFKMEYELVLDLGQFLERNHTRRILEESLVVNDAPLFTRSLNSVDWAVFADLPRAIRGRIDRSRLKERGVKDAVSAIVKPDGLVLPVSESVIGPFFPELVQSWFRDRLLVGCSNPRYNTLFPPSEDLDAVNEKGFVASESVNAAARRIGLSSEAMGYRVENRAVDPVLRSLVPKKTGDTETPRAEDFESHGTVRFAYAVAVARKALAVGATLMVDEFDASLHPTVTQALIQAFHNDEVNVHKAQLIFTTHNPVYMNKYLCRRDELMFVDRTATEKGSECWSLADFGTSGKEGVRSMDDYLHDYMTGCYGAIDWFHLEDVLGPQNESN